MTQAQYLREQANRADRLASNVLDAVTVTRLVEASQDYRREADRLERSSDSEVLPVVESAFTGA